METDSFFCQLLKQLPETLFELLGLPAQRAKSYRFDSVEIKKSFRIDGLFLPKKASLPLYFVEVQFSRLKKFYANLFAKVFLYLEENDPSQEWFAVAIFPTRAAEPKNLGPYGDLLQSKRVKRIYLDEFPMPANPPLGLGILQLVSAPQNEAVKLVDILIEKTKRELAHSDLGPKVLQLVEEVLIRRFSRLNREEIRKMFKLQDLRKTRVWQEAMQEGKEMGRTEGVEKGRAEGKALAKKEMVKVLAKSIPVQQIAELLNLPVEEVRSLARDSAL